MINRALFLVSLAYFITLNLGNGKPLFNGKNLEGWTVVVDGEKPGEDPKNYVQVKNGVIHMYPDVEDGAEVPFGYLRTNQSYSSYRLTLEYRWSPSGKKFEPRKKALRDAGLLFHQHGKDMVWPACVECQIQEGDTGDLVLLYTQASASVHPNPKLAPEGQGDAGLLMENGGVVADLNGVYLGRYADVDKREGWNKVEVVVYEDRYAEFRVNGAVVSRVTHMRKKDGTPLKEGFIGIQLEAAEIEYRNIEIHEHKNPLQLSGTFLSLSSVDGQKSQSAKVMITNTTKAELPCKPLLVGIDESAFTLSEFPKSLKPGESANLTVSFKRDEKNNRFLHHAGIRVLTGDEHSGVFIGLKGIGQKKFEGKNEPPLQDIINALASPTDAGGSELHLDTKNTKIGDSIEATHFKAVGEAKVKLTPLARYSPAGEAPFGIVVGGKFRELGKLGDSTEDIPDAHQTLMPPIVGSSPFVELSDVKEAFAVYFIGHKQTASTDPASADKANIPHTARVYPVRYLQGRALNNAFVIGFEEASNGDYQDGVFLIENVKVAR